MFFSMRSRLQRKQKLLYGVPQVLQRLTLPWFLTSRKLGLLTVSNYLIPRFFLILLFQ